MAQPSRRFLVLYSTVDGHTRRICERLQQVIERNGHRVELASVDEARIDLAAFDRVVIGASIRYGRHRRSLIDFINANAGMLQDRPGALFSVNVVARKPNKNTAQTNPYLRKLLRQISWRPDRADVFAGRLDYPSYGALDRTVIRFIMWLTGGPTDPHTVVEFTDWQRVDAFGESVSAL